MMLNQDLRFAFRYVGTPGRGKSLKATEAAAFRAAGISIGGVYEDREGTSLLGSERGKRDCDSYFSDAYKLGMPIGRPGYFATDTDTTGAKVYAYYKAIADTVGVARSGAYGGLHIIKFLFDEGLISWGWQTRAWSKVGKVFVWDARAQVRQFPVASPFYVYPAGVGCDLDWAMTEDFGQWDYLVPGPTPQPVPDKRVLFVSDASRKDPEKHPYMSDKDAGAHGEIKLVQDKLYIMPRSKRDGVYGVKTETAVKNMQKANPPLKADGVVGPKTWAVLLK
jgi:peptidoglycan hydrolase-like protein with peptidoglycan-binding domain